MVRLSIFDGQDKLADVPLGDDVLTIGREESNAIVLSDISVSRRHAQIEPSGNFFLIRDRGSTNGTFVNDLLVRAQVLNHGDTVRVGKYLIRVDSHVIERSDSTRVRVEQLQLPTQIFEPPADETGHAGENTSGLESIWSDSADRRQRSLDLQDELGYVDAEDALLHRALELAMNETLATRGIVLLPEGPGPGRTPDETDSAASFTVAAFRNRATRDAATEEVVISRELIARIQREGEPLAGELPSPASPGARNGFMAVPLLNRSGVSGVMYLEREPGQPAFTAKDLQFVVAVARQTAVALANAHLFARISQEKAKIQTVFASLTDGVLVTNEVFEVIEANRAATILLGLDHVNPLGSLLFDLFSEFEVNPDPTVLMSNAFKEGGIFQLRGDDHVGAGLGVASRFLSGSVTPYPRDARTPQGFVVTLRDRSESRYIEELKTHFLEKLAHKLRTPLTVIQGNLPFLRSGDEDPATTSDILSDLERSSELLGELIDEFMEFIEIETRAVRSASLPRPIDIRSLTQDVVDALLPEAIGRAIAVRLIDGDDILEVQAHGDLLGKAFREILGNALKFTPPGGTVTIQAAEVAGSVRVDFNDDGPGIPENELESVFYVCHQVDKERTGQVPGAGLGLTLARQIVQRHGGEIKITSPFGSPDRGTQVTVLLPRRELRPEHASASEGTRSTTSAQEARPQRP